MEIGSRFSNGIEGPCNAEEILFFRQGETPFDRLFEVFRDLRFFSVLSQCPLEQGRRSGAIRMRSGENDVISQGC